MVLWVDDPRNNRYERQALEALGLRFALSTSTDDALNQLRHQSFDLIISDMGRPPDSRAGYTLLDKLRSQGDRTPFVIYAGSGASDLVLEANRRGAVSCTDSPQELIRTVTHTLGTTPGRTPSAWVVRSNGADLWRTSGTASGRWEMPAR